MQSGKLFVGGISWDTNEDRLREYFQAFGDVVEAVIMKDRTTGRARGFGFVVFADPSIAEKVVKEKHMIDGRTVEAKKAVPRDDQHVNRTNGSIQGSPGPVRTKKIFVGGLASSVTETDFKKYFDQFGTITDVVVMYDQNTQRPRGFGFITYESEEAVDKVLYKKFHELNGKMVEVKHAVPKELSPGPIQSQLGRYNNGVNRVNNFLNAYPQGYSPSSMGSYGVGMEGRYSPTPVGRNGYSSLTPADYNMGERIDHSRLSSSFGGSGNFNSILGYGRNLSSFHDENSNRHNVPAGYAPGRAGNGSVLNSTGQNMWENESLYYGTDYANTTEFVGFGSGNTGLSGAFGGRGTIWGSSPISGQGGHRGSFGGDNITFSNGETRFDGGAGYGQNARSNADAKSSYAPIQGVHAKAFGDIYGPVSGSIYEDSTWRASSPELDSSEALTYGLRSADSLDYVGGYSFENASTRGIAA
ncbi:uncharacterized protein LOC107784125 isoform X2 [Nicotiana tabacum]|uniref:Heterogeneous nuclear ribonucleoprotein 1 n=1 Tax=Nicotiana tabacum TaxID=4097 RepID=A0A1S3Z8G0_TOBAC|nr:PREDICTED: heterogeneous nuclear ribonucleoprotein 1-like [Nicotiana tabacum]